MTLVTDSSAGQTRSIFNPSASLMCRSASARPRADRIDRQYVDRRSTSAPSTSSPCPSASPSSRRSVAPPETKQAQSSTSRTSTLPPPRLVPTRGSPRTAPRRSRRSRQMSSQRDAADRSPIPSTVATPRRRDRRRGVSFAVSDVQSRAWPDVAPRRQPWGRPEHRRCFLLWCRPEFGSEVSKRRQLFSRAPSLTSRRGDSLGRRPELSGASYLGVDRNSAAK